MITPKQRWEEGIDHDPRSEEIIRAMAKLDVAIGGDALWINIGGDGDNGEHMMYLLDCYFEAKDNNLTLDEYLKQGK